MRPRDRNIFALRCHIAVCSGVKLKRMPTLASASAIPQAGKARFFHTHDLEVYI